MHSSFFFLLGSMLLTLYQWHFQFHNPEIFSCNVVGKCASVLNLGSKNDDLYMRNLILGSMYLEFISSCSAFLNALIALLSSS